MFTIKDYYQLTKPGIIGGNLISALGGFFLASGGHFNIALFACVVIGVSLIVASGCVVNNVYDKDIDALMPRTKKRTLVNKELSLAVVFSFAALLGLAGFFLLWLGVNLLTALLGLLGFLIYVLAYTIWLKRRHPISTIVGSISGALPPVMGYCAITNQFDLGAWLLLLLFALWQMPHHYAIGIFRLADYKAAKIPVLPAVIGVPKTLFQIKGYIIAFWCTGLLLYFFDYCGLWYAIIISVCNAWWLVTAFNRELDEKKKARKLFFQSILVICIHSLMMSINSLL